MDEKDLENALQWAKCHEAISFLLEEKIIFDNEYSQIRERMIQRFFSDSERK